LVFKHIVQVVLDDYVLPINVVVGRQAWLCIFIRAFAQSCSLIGCNVEVSFIQSFSLFRLRFLVLSQPSVEVYCISLQLGMAIWVRVPDPMGSGTRMIFYPRVTLVPEPR
jgi:hypothetical protein